MNLDLRPQVVWEAVGHLNLLEAFGERPCRPMCGWRTWIAPSGGARISPLA